uniref:Uncharacterized protein n=1 Tax=Triticum urartu TaxID=4572 RepID=A0A8R7TQU2_TRIUA
MEIPGCMMNCSRNWPARLLGMSIASSSGPGIPSACSPSPSIRNWLPTMNDPDTRTVISLSPSAPQCIFSTT